MMIREERRERKHEVENIARTHSHPGRHEIDLVQHVDQLFMRLFLFQKLDDRFTPGSHGVSGIEHVDDDVGRVEHLVEFSPDTTRGTFGVDGFGHEGSDGVEGSGLFDVCIRVGLYDDISSGVSMVRLVKNI